MFVHAIHQRVVIGVDDEHGVALDDLEQAVSLMRSQYAWPV